MRRVILLALLPVLAGVLSGCSLGAAPPPAAPVTSFGPWQQQGCTLSIRAADVWLRTQGRLTANGALLVEAHFTPVIIRPPFATLTGGAFPVPAEGSNRRYTFYLPYTPESGAAMLQEGAMLTVSYQPLGGAAIQDVSFPTKPLMLGLGALQGCP